MSGILPILALLFVVGPASARHPDASPPEDSEFLLPTPEAKMQAWRDGLLEFLAQHPDLTSEQAYAVETLAAIGNPKEFSQILGPGKKDLFAKHLDELARVLSYRDYLKILRSLDFELRVWLVSNGLVLASVADTPTCNCTQPSSGCSAGFSCNSSDCIHSGGTTHNGVCSAASTVLEQ
jgi:hypothetical protein